MSAPDFTPVAFGDSIEEITAPKCDHYNTEWIGANWTCLDCGAVFRESAPRKPEAQTPPVFAVSRDATPPESYQGNALAARVACANRANYLATVYAAYVIERLRPFLNQKVLKNTSWGTALTKKVEAALGDAILPEGSGENLHISTQGHWITVRCTVSRSYGEYRNQSFEAYSTVGKTGGTDMLQALEEKPVKLRTDYNEAEIRGKRVVVAGLRQQLSAAQSALDGWGEYDR